MLDYGGALICRRTVYYVSTSATNQFELGTIEFPFKHLKLPFVDLWNNFIGSTPKTSVYLKRGDTIPLHSLSEPLKMINSEIIIEYELPP